MDYINKAIQTIRAELPNIECKPDEPMKNHTSFKIGAPVQAMFFPKETQELTKLCQLLSELQITPLIFGNGSNLIVEDSRPLEMIAVKTTGLNNAALTGETGITAQAGAPLSKLAELACRSGLTGLEFVHGVPGTLGGAVTMNAGAYGMEMKDVIVRTTALSCGTGIYDIVGEEHRFAYRTSRFSDTDDIVLSSVILLKKADEDSIRAKMDELLTRRHSSQPLDVPNAGSTFKRPKDGYAAALIEQAGLKGFSVGGAQVSPKHSGFIINNGTATFKDIMAVIEHIRETVYERTGIDLEPENKIVQNLGS